LVTGGSGGRHDRGGDILRSVGSKKGMGVSAGVDSLLEHDDGFLERATVAGFAALLADSINRRGDSCEVCARLSCSGTGFLDSASGSTEGMASLSEFDLRGM
jgi:hypothetical protein